MKRTTVFQMFSSFIFHRAYISVKELKEELNLSSADTLNVFFANNSVREELAGAATWPWAKEALTHQGGLIHLWWTWLDGLLYSKSEKTH